MLENPTYTHYFDYDNLAAFEEDGGSDQYEADFSEEGDNWPIYQLGEFIAPEGRRHY